MQLLYGNSCMMNDFYKKELQCCVYSNEYYNSVSNRSIKKSTLHKLLLNEMAKHRTITGLAKGFFLHKRCNSIAKVTKNSVANKTMLFFLSFWVNSYIVAKDFVFAAYTIYGDSEYTNKNFRYEKFPFRIAANPKIPIMNEYYKEVIAAINEKIEQYEV